MSAGLLIGWAIVGWCGTPWPRKWPWPPPPDPNPWISKIIGVVGGIAGGWVFGAMLGADMASATGMVLTAIGAWAGSVLLNDVYGLVGGRQAG